MYVDFHKTISKDYIRRLYQMSLHWAGNVDKKTTTNRKVKGKVYSLSLLICLFYLSVSKTVSFL